MPGRCVKQFVWVQHVSQCVLLASGEIKKTQLSVAGFAFAKSTYNPLPVVLGVWSNHGDRVVFDNYNVFLLELDYYVL
ncbi:hypothetical protein DPMN_158849 [Dreissena polymorpha]|uniref:Uncharacterized protein n=1 Tax=Dreissena polymorpha TaxID=45954 RepID=A0A9D4IQ66_DREPO|nr:hypothetical protein DPMN_158849 [Dreissena polymorpha]